MERKHKTVIFPALLSIIKFALTDIIFTCLYPLFVPICIDLYIIVDSYSTQKCIFYSLSKGYPWIAQGIFQRLLLCSIELIQPWQGRTLLQSLISFSETNLNLQDWPDNLDTGNSYPTFQHPLSLVGIVSLGALTDWLSPFPCLAPGPSHTVTSSTFWANQRKEITMAENDYGTWLQVVT